MLPNMNLPSIDKTKIKSSLKCVKWIQKKIQKKGAAFPLFMILLNAAYLTLGGLIFMALERQPKVVVNTSQELVDIFNVLKVSWWKILDQLCRPARAQFQLKRSIESSFASETLKSLGRYNTVQTILNVRDFQIMYNSILIIRNKKTQHTIYFFYREITNILERYQILIGYVYLLKAVTTFERKANSHQLIFFNAKFHQMKA